MKFDTQAVQGGHLPGEPTGAVSTPVYQTSTYAHVVPGQPAAYSYARSQNPTRTALQTALARLENARHGLCFALGMAATDALLRTLRPGQEVIVTRDVYGGTQRLFTKVYEDFGVKFTFADLTDPAALGPLLNEKTQCLWLETPTNPLLHVLDIEQLTATARAAGVLTVVDSTFASPYLQQPLALGADVAMHSATKYLGGHSDVVLSLIHI